MDLDGIIGAGLLAPFRVTLADQGRALWLESFPVDPSMLSSSERRTGASEPMGPPEAPGRESSAPVQKVPVPVVPASRPSGHGNIPVNPSTNVPLNR
jgi:hypothetical protein